MHAPRCFWIAGVAPFLILAGSLSAQSEEPPAIAPDQQLAVEHSDCPFFGPQRERFVTESAQVAGDEAIA